MEITLTIYSSSGANARLSEYKDGLSLKILYLITPSMAKLAIVLRVPCE
jgi:hypothetical protein